MKNQLILSLLILGMAQASLAAGVANAKGAKGVVRAENERQSGRAGARTSTESAEKTLEAFKKLVELARQKDSRLQSSLSVQDLQGKSAVDLENLMIAIQNLSTRLDTIKSSNEINAEVFFLETLAVSKEDAASVLLGLAGKKVEGIDVLTNSSWKDLRDMAVNIRLRTSNISRTELFNETLLEWSLKNDELSKVDEVVVYKKDTKDSSKKLAALNAVKRELKNRCGIKA